MDEKTFAKIRDFIWDMCADSEHTDNLDEFICLAREGWQIKQLREGWQARQTGEKD